MKNKSVMSVETYERLVTNFIEANDPSELFDLNESDFQDTINNDPNEGRDY